MSCAAEGERHDEGEGREQSAPAGNQHVLRHRCAYRPRSADLECDPALLDGMPNAQGPRTAERAHENLQLAAVGLRAGELERLAQRSPAAPARRGQARRRRHPPPRRLRLDDPHAAKQRDA